MHLENENPELNDDAVDHTTATQVNPQRRRMLMMAAVVGGPMIVAGSAQTAHAQGPTSKVSGPSVPPTTP
ncbi:hypothetical protein Pla52o_42380 [Novipirellula galeiformis]|uniref:Uncharacterized protein n=1 Tax=Novipirellula galeiformis TaxID=2528004 RepID=A0A5C6CCN0_9BACT|nr:hypothetical protein [Novipirellula galeiformis]TWU21204.1 hypothetical protein Pla52o_42380 [Novipirellula galeiformis]